LGDGSFDAVVISVSVQYLTRPVEVFRDVHRILKPGGQFLVIFSNRMFFTKAVRIWTVSDDARKMDLVASYFQYADCYEDIRGTCRNPRHGLYEDPVYVVMASKPSSPSP
jgi:ubiquinone/menaquinone biosynthesis C-methylase UbiE